MESRPAAEEPFNPPLAEPHFDEEATLLSARPVVPLREVGAQSRSRRALVYGFAMTLAVIAGVLGATIVYKQRNQAQPTELIETATVAPKTAEVQPAVGAEGAVVPGSDGSASAVSAKAKDVTTQPPGGNTVVVVEKSAASSPAEIASRKNESQQAEADARRELRAARRSGQLRRMKEDERELSRESRERRPEARDLLRIREIFEGSPRP
jgi:hypothetical protein